MADNPKYRLDRNRRRILNPDLPLYVPTDLFVIALIGLPASGKTTLAKDLANSIADSNRANIDSMRVYMYGSYGRTVSDMRYFLAAKDSVLRNCARYLTRHTTGALIADWDNNTEKARSQMIDLAHQSGTDNVMFAWIRSSPKDNIERAAKRAVEESHRADVPAWDIAGAKEAIGILADRFEPPEGEGILELNAEDSPRTRHAAVLGELLLRDWIKESE